MLHNLCEYIYSLRCLACNAHAPYFHRDLPALHYFPLYLINGTIFEKKCYWTQNVFWFSLQCLSEIFFILRSIERDMIENVYCCSCKVPLILVRFSWNLGFSQQIFGKYLNIKFYAYQFRGSRVMLTDGRTERLTDTTKIMVAFRNFANATKNAPLIFEVIRCSLSCVVTFCTAFRQRRTASFHFVFNSFIHCPPLWSHYAELRITSSNNNKKNTHTRTHARTPTPTQ